MSNIDDYVSAVDTFNDINSFVITLPNNQTIYERLVCHTDDVVHMTPKLFQYETNKQNQIYNDELACEILKLVVHLNQIANGVK
uniref:Uncharacterized protein n=1 Tax=Pyramimonas orientalis virus TaxID=455367 RepID=A0A7L9AY53_POV01|nr:hypothetical protein HWQ62_00508 [Pyramimonas orientalis virus]